MTTQSTNAQNSGTLTHDQTGCIIKLNAMNSNLDEALDAAVADLMKSDESEC